MIKGFAGRKGVQLLFYALTIWFLWFAQTTLDDYSIRVLNNIAIFIILAVSYNLINGITGQLSLEPNGFVAIGAYVATLFLLDSDALEYQYYLEDPSSIVLLMHTKSFIIALLAGGAAATFAAMLLSFPVFRVRGDYLAIVTLGFGFIIRILAINNPQITNGSLGLNDIPDHTNLYWSGGLAMVAVTVILNIIYSKYGRAMKAVRDDEDTAIAMGVNTFKIKTIAFSTSAFMEGVGGGLLACLLTSVSPDQFTFFLTFQLLIIIVLGGLGSTTGAIIGTILVIGGAEWLRFLDEPMNLFGWTSPALPGMRMVVFSIILILVMLFAREGIMGKKELFDYFKTKKPKEKKVILNIDELTMRFGGVVAVNSISFGIKKGTIFGLIGPNGAGKTTIFNMITGNYIATSGSIKFNEKELVGVKPHLIVREGIARTFQNIRLFNSMSVLDNVLIGFDFQAKYTFLEAVTRLPRFFFEEKRIKKRAYEILEYLDILNFADTKATDLSYGQQRKVEIARALATKPKMLLLDEPAAGMNPVETEELAKIIFKAREDFGLTILLIEHDMKFVNRLCEEVLVLDYGKTIFEGAPSEAIQNKEVISAYLGDFKHD